MSEIGPEHVRKVHRDHMRLMGEWKGQQFDRDYEREVVDAVMGALQGTRERPFLHSHAATELGGACQECDAAYVLEILEAGK